MQAGKLDQRVTLERFTTTHDDWGSPIEAWAPLATVWAAVEPLNGREYIAAMQAQAETTARIRMRYRPGITQQDRVIHEGKTYGIEAVLDVRSQGKALVLMCKALG